MRPDPCQESSSSLCIQPGEVTCGLPSAMAPGSSLPTPASYRCLDFCKQRTTFFALQALQKCLAQSAQNEREFLVQKLVTLTLIYIRQFRVPLVLTAALMHVPACSL